MATAVDTSVLLDVIMDVIMDDPVFGDRSKAALQKYSLDGIIVCETTLAEIVPALNGRSAIEFLQQWDLEFFPSSVPVAVLAGQMHAQFLKRGGKRGRVLADFMIGASAQLYTGALLARDRGYFRDYFAGLKVIDPSAD
jgi:predicted nucleic acid-binding protein